MKFLAIVFFVIVSTPSHAQLLKLPQLVSNEVISSATLLPDSSLLLLAENGNNSEARRFVYRDMKWVSTPNTLTTTINGLSTQHKHFRFSPDFQCILVLINERKTERCYLIKKSGNDQWGLPVEVLRSNRGEFNHSIPGLSADNTKLYMTAYGILANHILDFDISDQAKFRSLQIDEFSTIFAVVPVANNSFLLKAEKKSDQKVGYYFIKATNNSQYTAPLYINELAQDLDYIPNEISMTSYAGWVLFTKPASGDLFLTKLNESFFGAWDMRSTQISQVSTIAEPEALKNIDPQGQYHALLIGNNDYIEDGLDLDMPISDVQTLKEILVNQYTFDEANVHVVTNANRLQIFSELYTLRKSLTRKDNLLIFYAGHGYWDKNVEQGYWWPVDASTGNPANWLSNSDLREQIRGIHTAHTLLISDACFSGGIFRTRGVEDLRDAGINIQLLYRMPSRRAISSGTLSTVPDNSVFFQYLSKYLEENELKYLPSTELFTQVRRSVLNNSTAVPQDGVIMGSGDEGGDFIFIRRKEN